MDFGFFDAAHWEALKNPSHGQLSTAATMAPSWLLPRMAIAQSPPNLSERG
jgi:hypothetical protein